MAPDGESIPRVLFPLAKAGDATADAVRRLSSPARAYLERADERHIVELGNALGTWDDEVAAALLTDLDTSFAQGIGEPLSLAIWVERHLNDASSVSDCLAVVPPAGIRIKGLLSRRGGQKVVFLAEWPIAGRQVVVKKLVAPAAEQSKVLGREFQAHPLSINHPNIIETHSMSNVNGDVFLVEEFLSEIIGDEWEAQGLEEAATLLFDIASALAYLHEAVQRVHADVKPDNIGRRGDSFVLLDFGMCRPMDQLAEATATGSLRTRAPEVLSEGAYAMPDRVDTWALGAVLFKAFEHRFPLFDEGEAVPPISDTAARAALVEKLKDRAEREWDQRLSMPNVPGRFKSVLQSALKKDPRERVSAADLRNLTLNSLGVYLRRRAFDSPRFSPVAEIKQYSDWLLPNSEALRRLPLAVRQKTRARLLMLETLPSLSEAEQRTVRELLAIV